MGDRTINIPQPEARQIPILNNSARFKALKAGRRWGKTTMGIIASTYGHGPIDPVSRRPRYPGAIFGSKIWWAAPTAKNYYDVWRDLKDATFEIWSEKDIRGNTVKPLGSKSEIETRIEFPGGGSITVRSTELFANLRGPGVDGMILDEAAFMHPKAWPQVLRPMLGDRQGWAIFYSTPSDRSRSWFENLCKAIPKRRGWAFFEGISTDNPRFTEEELDEIRSDPDLSEADFRREYLAEWPGQGDSKFKEEYFRYFEVDAGGEHYLLGSKAIPINACFRFCVMDLATSMKKRSDYTVVQVWDVTPRNEMLLIHQIHDKIPGTQHLDLIQSVYDEFRPSSFGIEKSGFQLSLVQRAIEAGIPVEELSPKDDKETRSDTLASRMSQGKVYIDKYAPYRQKFVSELLDYPSTHDDQLDAAAYAAIKVASRMRTLLASRGQIESVMTLPSQLIPTGSTFDGGRGPTIIPYTLDTMNSAINPDFRSNSDWPWHVHLSRKEDAASLTLGRIYEWRTSVQTVGGQPVTMDTPMIEVPLILKFVEASDESLLADYIIVLKQARKFNITSVSTRGIISNAVLQKLERAKIGVVPFKIQEAYIDLKIVMQEGRLQAMQSGHLEHELPQIDESGKSLAFDDTTASALAGTVGSLSRFGHQALYSPGYESVGLKEVGLGTYQGLNY